ncbi:hypothetical protein [Amycolatopsis coloradensis]|uniref:hypothetical protein n=1 Tax=Amycolatopsis coloradensis TaxID=76021 RepID=UPI001FC9BD83|nr:hypothetical protein [Amycolatopsis coloradensis]
MLRPILDPTPAEWISSRLGGGFGAACRTVPRGYAAYARLCHPAERDRGGWANWSEAAAETGRRAHGAMQWHALVGSPDPVNLTGSLWRGSPPGRGTLPSHSLAALPAVLGDHTSTSAPGSALGKATAGPTRRPCPASSSTRRACGIPAAST